MLILPSGYRQVTIHIKQARIAHAPWNVNFLNRLFSMCECWRYSTEENKSRKLYINKYKNGNNAQFFG